jgi:glycosyltransferase involved in cell wall biosynthesis
MTGTPRPNLPRIAFHAPMKAPDHPTPSGDRRIARLTMAALERAGFDAACVSRLRSLDMAGDSATQARIHTEAKAEAARLIAALAPDPPTLWFTYHCYFKAPDLVGPAVAGALGIPYAISEASVSPKRRDGPWAGFAVFSDAAIARANRLFWTTARDRPGLEAAGHGAKMVQLPAFLDLGPPPAPRPAGAVLRLLTVAMMRPGDKLESYRRLAAALAHLPGDWRLTLIGDGAAREAVLSALSPFAARLTVLAGLDEPDAIRPHYETADLLVWPGVNEGVGMAWLEAQAAGLPVVAEDGPAARSVIGGGLLATPDDPPAFAGAIRDAAADRAQLSARARAHVEARHSLDAAAAILRTSLSELIP